MKTVYSPELVPGEDPVTVVIRLPREYARGGLVKAAAKVRKAGRYGDDMLVHMNKSEFAMLRKAWGEPTVHPETGLPEYFSLGSVLGSVGDAFGGWGSVAKNVLPWAVSALTGKAQADVGNRNVAPPMDPNLTTHIGSNATFNRTPSGAYGPNTDWAHVAEKPMQPFYKPYSLNSAAKWTPGAQVKPVYQESPSTGSLIGTSVLGGLTSAALQKWLPKLFEKSAAGAAAAPAAANTATYGGLGALGGQSAGIGAGGSLIGTGGAAAADAAGAGSVYTPTLGIPFSGPAAAVDASYMNTPGAIMEASSPGAGAGLGGSALAGMGMGLGTMAAAYGVSRILANQGHMNPQDWKKHMAGSFATANDAYTKAAASGDINAKAHAWQQMQQAAQGYASRLMATKDPNDAALAKQIYGQFGQVLPTWYTDYLRGHSGGTGGGKAFAYGGLAMADGGVATTGQGIDEGAPMMGGPFQPGQPQMGWGNENALNVTPEQQAQQQAWITNFDQFRAQNPNAGLSGMMNYIKQNPQYGGTKAPPVSPWLPNGQPSPAGSLFDRSAGGTGMGAMLQGQPPPASTTGPMMGGMTPSGPGAQAQLQNAPPQRALPQPMPSPLQRPQPGGGNMGQNTGGPGNGNMYGGGAGPIGGPRQAIPPMGGQPSPPTMGFPMQRPAFPPPASTTGPMMGGMTPSGPGAQAQMPNAPRTGLGMNPAWSPTGSPQQNAMPGPAASPTQAPRMQIPTPMQRNPMATTLSPNRGMGLLGRNGFTRGFDQGGPVQGPGTGTSDSIPARLSVGEYVIPAHVVAALGDGSTEAGAKKLDELQHRVRVVTGKQMSKGKHPKPVKPPLEFINDLLAAQDMDRQMKGRQ